MKCLLSNLVQYMNTLLSVSEFQDFCINGLQVEGKKQVEKVATCVTGSLNAIRKAKKIGADLLICHHGLFLKGKDLVISGTIKEKLKILIESQISLCGYHLPLDAHLELGNNWPAAKLLGFYDLEPFGEFHGKAIGVKGMMKKTTSEELCQKLEAFYKRKADVVLTGPKTISSFALVSGSGHKLLEEAKKAAVDCLITGTTDEPVWHVAHEEKINFFSLGHFATERLGVQLLGEHLKDEFGIKHSFIDEENPF